MRQGSLDQYAIDHVGQHTQQPQARLGAEEERNRAWVWYPAFTSRGCSATPSALSGAMRRPSCSTVFRQSPAVPSCHRRIDTLAPAGAGRRMGQRSSRNAGKEPQEHGTDG